MPIAPSKPRDWMVRSHILPEQSVRAFMELGARHFIPMHWGTFWFGTEAPLESLYATYKAWHANIEQLQRCHLHPLRFGQSCYIDASQPQMQYETDRILLPHEVTASERDI